MSTASGPQNPYQSPGTPSGATSGVHGTPPAMYWTGWVISGLVAALMAFSGAMKFSTSPQMTEGFEHLGWPIKLAVTLGILELTSTLLYSIPKTAVLGAILLTGYLGGAIATHV